MLRLFLLRHGQTQFNIQEITQGWNDSPLTELGLYQPKCTGYGLRKTIFTKAYSGDIKRQMDTAKQFMSVNEHPIEIIPDMHFREMCYGKWQGTTYEYLLTPLLNKFGKKYTCYDDIHKYMSEYEMTTQFCLSDETGQTEGPERAYQRFKQGLDIITNENKDGNILISTSSVVIYFVLLNLFPNLDQKHLVDNASITIIDYDNNQYTLEDYNDTSYRDIGDQYFKTNQ